MPTSFPIALDNFTNPTPADKLITPTVLHSDQHSNENDAIEALEAKVGIDGSTDPNSLDYRISHAGLAPFDPNNPADVGALPVVGTSGSPSHGDHAHRGVHGLFVPGNNSQYGDLALVGQNGVVVAQSSGSFTFETSGSFVPVTHGINSAYHDDFPLTPANGGTGIDNGSRTITLNTNNAIFTFNGAYALTIAGNASVLGTNTGDQDLSGYVPTSRLINTTAPLIGGGNLSADRTLSIPAATATVDGYLTAADWVTFNNKTGGLTPFQTDSPADVGASAVTGTSGSVPHADHVHRGVHGIFVAPNTDLFGDIQLVGSNNILITQSSGSFTFESSGSFVPVIHGINGPYHDSFPLLPSNGGTGINNGSNTLTLLNSLTVGGGTATTFLSADGTYRGVPTNLSLFLDNAASGITGYLSLAITVPTDSEQFASASIPSDGTVIEEFALPAASFNFLVTQTMRAHLNMARTGGAKNITVYVEVYHRTSGGTETLLGTSGVTGNLAIVKTSYDFDISISDKQFAATDRFVIKVLGNPIGGGSTPTATIYYEGTNYSRIDVNTSLVVGGSDTQVQFNDAGAFGGDSAFTWNKTSDTLSVSNLKITGLTTGLLRIASNDVAAISYGSQYSVLQMGATLPAFSSFLLDGTSGGKTVFDVSNTKTLTISAANDYTLTVPATGTAALGTGTATRIAEWASTNTLQASTLIKTGVGVLTLDAPGSNTMILHGDWDFGSTPAVGYRGLNITDFTTNVYAEFYSTAGTKGSIDFINNKGLAVNENLTLTASAPGYTLTLAGDATVSGVNSGGANPTASVGLSVVNGSATTFMRSDAAPALDQAIAPTWSGNHTWTSGQGMFQKDGGSSLLIIEAYGGTGGANAPVILGRRARNTLASPQVTQLNDVMMTFGGIGYDGSAFGTTNYSVIQFTATETHSTTAHGAKISFQVTPNASTTRSEVVKIEQDGSLQIITTTDSTSTSTGSFITAGGVGIAKAVVIGTTLAVGRALSSGVIIDVAGSSAAGNVANYIANTASVNVANTVGIDLRANSSAQERTALQIKAGFSTTTDGSRVSTATFSTADAGTFGTAFTIVGKAMNFAGVVNVDDTTDSTSSTTGALIVDGGAGIAKALGVGTVIGVGTTPSATQAISALNDTIAGSFNVTDSGTTNTPIVAQFIHNSSGTPAAGFGMQIPFFGKSSTTASRTFGVDIFSWVVATDASRTARRVFNIYDTAAREAMRIEASGTAPMIGFLGSAAAARQTSGANLTNNVTSGGTNDTIDNWTSLTTYSTDAAAIRNAVYQLARKLKQVNDALRTYGLLT